MANPHPWFPLYAKDLLTSTAAMEADTLGVYIRLLAFSWENCGLPVDAESCRRIGVVDRDVWPRIWSELEPKWPIDGDKRRNLRQEVERQQALAVQEAKSRGGKAGAETRRRAKESRQESTQDSCEQSGAESTQESRTQPQSQSQPQTDARPDGRASVARAQEPTPAAVVPFDPKDGGAWPAARYSPGNAWHSTIGKPVKAFLHAEFVDSLANAGDPNPERTLLDWYAGVEDRYRGRADGRDPIKFWRDEFALRQGTPNTKQHRQLAEGQRAVELLRERRRKA